jgi:dTDP-4-dehydrorhamnose 3,5-epimerase
MSAQNHIQPTELADVYIINRPTYTDERGFFREIFRKPDLEILLDINLNFMQANHSRSSQNTLRGIHVAPWHKLVTVTRGLVQQVIVDARTNSPTFGKYISVELGEDKWQSVFVPANCGNAFLVLSDYADYNYLTTELWKPDQEKHISWNDKDINIKWQTTSPSLSDKDTQNSALSEVYPFPTINNA